MNPQDKVISFFEKSFNTKPQSIARAPGRVEVLGNHTDYNEGFVLSFALNKEIYAAIAKSDSSNIELCSTTFPTKVTIDTNGINIPSQNSWINYVVGVYKVLLEKGYDVKPFKIAIDGNIPLGSGLSSSAALEVSTALALCNVFNLSIPLPELAKICQRAENIHVGTKCGLLDQFSSLFGKKNSCLFIDFRTLEHDTISIPDPELCIAVTISGASHSLVESAYNDRRRECFTVAEHFSKKLSQHKTLRDISMSELLQEEKFLDPICFKRAKHVVGEDERVKKGFELLKKGSLVDFGKLLYESHESSKNNFENSCPELDILVDITSKIDGVYGSRLTGGGFGGATLTLLPKKCKDMFETTILKQYKEKSGKTAIVHFAEIADGASVI